MTARSAHLVIPGRSCGLGAAQLPPGFDPVAMYDEGYFQGEHDDGYADYLGSRDTLMREFSSTVSWLEQHRSGGRLLEIGCAYGFFLEAAKATFDCTGIEVADDAVRRAAERGLPVHQGPVSRAELQELGPFDVAVMLDVIEHLVSPQEVIADLASVLDPGAHLVITTGDWGALSSRALGRRWRLMTPPQHLFFFTQESITQMLAAQGFRVMSIDHPWKTVPVGLALYQIGRFGRFQRWAKRSKLSGLGVPVNLFDAMRVLAVRE